MPLIFSGKKSLIKIQSFMQKMHHLSEYCVLNAYFLADSKMPFSVF